MSWHFLTFDYAVAHICSSELVSVVVSDLCNRECALDGDKTIYDASIDLPGMCSMKRPWSTTWVDGLKLEIPCEDVVSFAEYLAALPERIVGGKSLVKLHGFCKCLVLEVPTQRDLMLASMRSVLVDAERRAAEFYAVNALPSDVLRQAASRVHGTPIDEVPNLGGNKQDRFRPGGLHGKKGDA